MNIIINYKIPQYDSNKIKSFDIINKYIIDLSYVKIQGGDIFDDLNLDDIIIKKEVKTEEIIKPKVSKYIEKGIINNDLIKQHKIQIKKEKVNKKDITIYNIKNIKFGNYNNLQDIKLLIYYLLNIPIENQYLYNSNNSNLFYSYQNSITEEQFDINLENIIKNENTKYFNNLPIDFDLINNRSSYNIKTYEKNNYINDILDNNLELNLYNLDDLIPNKNIINNEIQKDNEILTIIFYGFIEKYFPYYNDNLFLLYLTNDNKYLEFPNLKFSKDYIIKKNNKLFEVYQPIDKSINKLLDKYYKKLIFTIPSYNNIKNINLQEIFNNLEIKKINSLQKIELQLYLNDNYVYFSKINIINYIYENNTYDDLIINNKKINSLIDTQYLENKNIILFLYKINDTKYEIEQDIIILLDEYFNFYIIYDINDYNSLELKVYENIILDKFNIFLTNLYKNNILENKRQISNNNLNLLLFDYEIIFNHNIGINEFKNLINDIRDLEITDYLSLSEIDNFNNIINLNLYKIDYLTKNVDLILSDYTNNYYNYYTNFNLVEKYKKIVYNSNIIFNNRVKDIQIKLKYINKFELENIYNIILFLLDNLLDSKVDNKESSSNINKLKKLKEIDPVLYNINQKNTNNLYSRKCQSSQQPDILTETEYKKTKPKNAIKYWNFTRGENVYYYCNSKKFPTVKFLTNLHPNNYCVPCCKKKSIEDVKIKSKYINIHNECLKNYIYDKKKSIIDEKSRYIMNYSSKIIIENLRLMNIPDVLIKLFKKIYETDNEDNIDLNYYIMGINQDINNLSNIGIIYILAYLFNKNIFDTIEFIKKIFINNPNFINNIYNGNLLNYFNNTKDFLVVFNNIFQNKILLNDLNYEFNEWNELFIDIAKYLGYIFIIFEEDEDLNIIIPKNTKYINEYLYNNDNYQYILLIKRIYKNKILYYPIIKTNYLEYYNQNKIYFKSFKYTDNIINLLSQVLKKKLNNKNDTSLKLSIIEEFLLLNGFYSISKYFINPKFEIYAILLEKTIKKNKEYIYIIIQKQKIINQYYNDKKLNKLFDNQYINIKKYNIKFNSILEFIKDYNKFIYSKNKTYYSEFYYKIYINEFNLESINNQNNSLINSQDNQNNIISYIYITNFLISNNKIIGVKIDNFNLYISKELDIDIIISLLNKKKKEISNILVKNRLKNDDLKAIFTREFNNYNFTSINYLYNPHTINNIIYNKTTKKDTRINKLNESIYHTNLYNLLILHFSYELNNLKNIILRNKIKLLINNMTNKDLSLIINNKYDKLKDILNKNLKITDNILILKIQNNINKFIKDVIIKNIKNLNINQIKKLIINKFDNNKFLFDKLYIYNILDLSKNEAINELNKILKSIIIDTNLNTKDNIINIELCNKTSNSYYCKNNKLIISKKLYYNLLEILYYDLSNPFKQTLILNLVNYNFNNIYKFKQYLNEKIYIFI
jgi:hypothetical protein